MKVKRNSDANAASETQGESIAFGMWEKGGTVSTQVLGRRHGGLHEAEEKLGGWGHRGV